MYAFVLSTQACPFHEFTLFVVLSLFTGGSPNADRKYSACVGGTCREKRGQQITQNHKMGHSVEEWFVGVTCHFLVYI